MYKSYSEKTNYFMPIPDMLIAFGVFGETLNLNVQENPIKYKYFVIKVSYTWLEQFFDSSPHKIEVETTPLPGSNH